MQTGELLRRAAGELQQSGCESARLDSEMLLMHAWQIERTALIIRARDEVPADIEARFLEQIERRKQREPVAYITGEKEFWSRPFSVNSDVLIPRPETEHLIEAVIEQLPDRTRPYHFCDIGTGSGCIAITLACEYPQASVVATDISAAALSVAKSNADFHQVSERVTFYHGDMLQPLRSSDLHFDAIISNPPYVAEDEMAGLESELAYEPRGALTDEGDGLRFLDTIINQGSSYLKQDGLIVVETGPCGLPQTTMHKQRDIIDLAGHLRGAVYSKRSHSD